MIPQAFINEWRAFAPWSTEAQIEQDLILSRAIVEIFSEPFLANSLAFRGGTALHKLFIQPAYRYSEDIDLVQINREQIGSVIEALRNRLNFWLGEPKWKLKEDSVVLIYRFDSESYPITPLRLKIEINTREHFTVLGLRQKHFNIKSRWFAKNVAITTFELEELIGTKLRALYQRKKGRDLFDLDIVLRYVQDIEISKIIKCFQYYLGYEALKVTRAEFQENLLSKMSDEAFIQDIYPLLSYPLNVHYDPHNAASILQEKIISCLPEGNSKRKGIKVEKEVIK